MKRSSILRSEIETINSGVNIAQCNFKNGSWIKVVTSNDNSRGNRSNVLIIDKICLVIQKCITVIGENRWRLSV